ncbi:hypothetical protein Sgleb_51730 [Streptomyces glebosus]|uniref:Ricin B lectin domain-containing protein n=1 Tax=Streptomyces glebosus TaxID=249580 RepID=A0A640T4B3_9ACTN|nr:hypothetical protein Sgleb_51730 [Streptomyces glebosus]GHG53700.1 hypothetical protein GCM10010513_14660 [Streptomyces glebosus]
MNSRFRAATAIAPVAALMPFVTAASASAAQIKNEAVAAAASGYSCPHDGYITNWDVCTEISNGVLLMNSTGKGTYIDVSYDKKSGGSVSCKVGYLRSGTNHWSSTKKCSTSLIASKQWSPSASCSPDVGLLYSGGSTYQTPPMRKC